MLQFCRRSIRNIPYMKIILSIFFVLILNFSFGQKFVEVGLNYGTSSLFRKNDASHYNYQSNEFGAFVTFNSGWKRNEGDRLKKFWLINPQVYFGNYEFYAENVSQKPFRAILYGGLKLQKPFNNFALNSKFLIGSGYQTGYHERLPGGIYFTEKLNLGVEFNLKKDYRSFVDLGVMHVSNGNFYPLNRGVEVFYVELGLKLPEHKK